MSVCVSPCTSVQRVHRLRILFISVTKKMVCIFTMTPIRIVLNGGVGDTTSISTCSDAPNKAKQCIPYTFELILWPHYVYKSVTNYLRSWLHVIDVCTVKTLCTIDYLVLGGNCAKRKRDLDSSVLVVKLV